jgi:hypothetical protein
MLQWGIPGPSQLKDSVFSHDRQLMTAYSRGLDESCHNLLMFGWVDPNRSNCHNRAGSVRKLLKTTRQLRIGPMFRSRVLAALLPAQDYANRDRVRPLVWLEYRPCDGCCLGLDEAGARLTSAFWNGLDNGRRRRD